MVVTEASPPLCDEVERVQLEGSLAECCTDLDEQVAAGRPFGRYTTGADARGAR